MPVLAPLAPRSRHRTIAVAAALSALTLLAACSDSKKPTAAASSGSSASASHSSSPSASNSSLSIDSNALPTTTGPAPSVPSKTTAPPAIVGCDAFDVGAINASTGHTWTPAKSRDERECRLTADSGELIRINFNDTYGQNDEVYANSQVRCDAGTVQPQQVADGAYVCVTEGVATGGLLVRAKNMVATLSPSHFGTASAQDVENTLISVLHAFVPPS